MKWLGGTSPFHLFTNPCVINRFIFGQGVVIYYILLSSMQHNKLFQINTLDSFMIIVKKPKYPFSLFSALFEENNQNLVKTEGINSI